MNVKGFCVILIIIGFFTENCFGKRKTLEDITIKTLELLIQQEQFIVIYWYGKNCKTCDRIVLVLEKIREELEEYGIKIYKLNDKRTAKKNGILTFPSLSFIKGGQYFTFDGDLGNPEELLSFLTSSESLNMADQIESVTAKILEARIKESSFLAVLYYGQTEDSNTILTQMELIDERADKLGIAFVKINDLDLISEYKFSVLPTLVYYRHSIPLIYEGNLMKEETVLDWMILNRKTFIGEENESTDIIENVTDLEKLNVLISSLEYLAVLFYDETSKSSELLLEALEQIDDDCDKEGIYFVKMDRRPQEGEEDIAILYGIKDIPSLLFFKKEIPRLFDGNLMDDSGVLQWLRLQIETESIEEVSGKLVDKMIQNLKTLIIVFYDELNDELMNEEFLFSLQRSLSFPIVRSKEIPKSLPEPLIPSFVFVKNGVSFIFSGDLNNKESILFWIENKEKSLSSESLFQTRRDYFEGKFVYLYDSTDSVSMDILAKLNKIAKNNQISVLNYEGSFEEFLPPSLLFVTSSFSHYFHGNLSHEEEVIKWLQFTSLEDVNIERLLTLQKLHDKLLIWLYEFEDLMPSDLMDKIQGKNLVVYKMSSKNNENSMFRVSSYPSLILLEKNRPERILSNFDWENTNVVLSMIANDLEKEKMELKENLKDEVKRNRQKQKKKKNNIEEKDEDDKFETYSDVVTLIYDDYNPIVERIMDLLKRVESLVNEDIFFKNMESDSALPIFTSFPLLVHFRFGHPTIYEGNLLNVESMTTWILEVSTLVVHDVIEYKKNSELITLLESNTRVLVYLYSEDCSTCESVLQVLEGVDDETDALGVEFVKTDELSFCTINGIDEFPSLIYFENGQPSIFEGIPQNEAQLLHWLLYQMRNDTIKNINRNLLFKMIEKTDFLAVFFYDESEESVKMCRQLEYINEDASQFGPRLVKISDKLMAKKYGHRHLPGLGVFRKGNYIQYDGDIYDDEEILDWLTDPNTMEIQDQIEKVNRKMFERLKSRNEFLAVFFYSELDCKQCPGILTDLEEIDDETEAAEIPLVKLDDNFITAKEIGVYAYPSLVFFRNFGEEVTIYTGDYKSKERIFDWLLLQKDPRSVAIEEFSGDELRQYVSSSHALAVVIYAETDCENCNELLSSLENIDDVTDRHGIQLIKTNDSEWAKQIGIHSYPSLLFFQRGLPNVYSGAFEAEEEILSWLLQMKSEQTIELINRSLLESTIGRVHYLVVFFYKVNCRTCDIVLRELETIDDECDEYGIQFCKIIDPSLAKRYGIKTFPALVYFRNGNPLTFEGDLKNESAVLEWLLDDDNRELNDEIEAVNFQMLDKLISSSQLLLVFYYDEDCLDCDVLLESLESIDDEADDFGIDFVKVADSFTAKQHEIYVSPALVYYRKGQSVVYDGDLMDVESLLDWLTSSDVFELTMNLIQVNRRLLEKLLEENDFVAVYFFESSCEQCDEILHKLETIDEEMKTLDIVFVTMNDSRYAKKYGVNRFPVLVYFRKKFPSIYRDTLTQEKKVLEWLKKNRFKHVELNVVLYFIFLLISSLVIYTLFLIFGFKASPKKKED